jgi:hypothetical protein
MNYFGNPLLLSDINFCELACSFRSDVNDQTWRVLRGKNDKDIYDSAQNIHELGIDSAVDTSPSPIILCHPIFEHRWLVSAVFWNGTVLGYAFSPECVREFEGDDIELMRTFCKISSFILMNSGNLGHADETGVGLTLFNLINGRHISVEILSKRLFPVNKTAEYLVAVAEPSPDRGDLHPHAYLASLLAMEFLQSKTAIINNRIVLLIRAEKNVFRSFSRERLEQRLKGFSLTCGLSNSFPQILDTRLHYEQALSSINYGMRFFPANVLHFYEDISLLRLLDVALQNGDQRNFCCVELSRIQAYDKEYSTKWFQTIFAFLLADCDRNQAAALLGIHRNTLTYRIGKTEEIMNSSFMDKNLVFKLKLSMRILFFMGRGQFCKEHNIPELWVDQMFLASPKLK